MFKEVYFKVYHILGKRIFLVLQLVFQMEIPLLVLLFQAGQVIMDYILEIIGLLLIILIVQAQDRFILVVMLLNLF